MYKKTIGHITSIFINLLVLILVFGTVIISITPNKALALTGLINSTVQNMNSGSTGSTSTTSSTTSPTTTSSSGGSLIDQINSTVQDMYSTQTGSASTSGSSSTSYTSTPPSCPFYSGHNRYVVNLNQSIRADMTLSRASFTTNTNLPAGTYNIRVYTWDNHSEHGGQDQNREQAVLRLLSSSGANLHTTNRTSDIPNNVNGITSTVASNVSIGESIRQIYTFHPEYPSSGPQSVTPVCAEFQRVSTVTPPPVEPPVSPSLNATCEVSRTRIDEGESIRFEADITGGRYPYTVNWLGDAYLISDFNRTTESQNVRFNNSGRYFIDLEVIDRDGRRSYDTCPVIIVDEDTVQGNLNVQCDLSRSTINVGDRLDIDAYVSGGTSPYYFDWSGDARFISGFNLTRQNQSVRINESGTYRLRIDVEDRYGNRGSDTCTVRVIGGTLARDINVYSGAGTPPSGELAGLSSVYLNQIPYTGTEEVVKVAGFISFVLIWSAAIAFYFLKDKKKKDISKKISEFKNLNKAKVLAD